MAIVGVERRGGRQHAPQVVAPPAPTTRGAAWARPSPRVRLPARGAPRSHHGRRSRSPRYARSRARAPGAVGHRRADADPCGPRPPRPRRTRNPPPGRVGHDPVPLLRRRGVMALDPDDTRTSPVDVDRTTRWAGSVPFRHAALPLDADEPRRLHLPHEETQLVHVGRRPSPTADRARPAALVIEVAPGDSTGCSNPGHKVCRDGSRDPPSCPARPGMPISSVSSSRTGGRAAPLIDHQCPTVVVVVFRQGAQVHHGD